MDIGNKGLIIVGYGEMKSAITEVLKIQLDAADSGIILVEKPEPVEFLFELRPIQIPESSPMFYEKPPRRSGQKYNRWK